MSGPAPNAGRGHDPEPSRLPRVIGRFDLTAAVINGVIGSAVFGLPGTLAGLVGAGSPLAALGAGVGILAVVLCFAEVASRFGEAGGPYLYARRAFGTVVGFEVGWLTFWTRVLSAAANLNVLATYAGALVPALGGSAAKAGVMALVAAGAAGLNVRGVRQAAWAVDLFTVAKLLPLVVLVGLGLFAVRADVLATQAVTAPDWTQAVLLLVFAYGGFETALIPAGEARDPRRDTAWALFVALAVIAVVYTLVLFVVVGVVPHAAGEAAPLGAALGRLLGPGGVVLAGVAVVISIGGWTLGSVLQSPRLLFAMAERGELPSVLARVHPRFRTPAVAVVTYAAISLALAVAGGFAANATWAAIVRLLYYALTAVALVVFRRRKEDAGAATFRAPAAVIVVPVAIGFCLWLLTTRSLGQVWILGLLVAAGLPLLWVGRRGSRGRATNSRDQGAGPEPWERP